jgi:hypothetical protein
VRKLCRTPQRGAIRFWPRPGDFSLISVVMQKRGENCRGATQDSPRPPRKGRGKLWFSSNLLDLFRDSAGSLAVGLGFTYYTADNRTIYFSVDAGLTSVANFATGVVNGDGRQASHWKDFLGLGIMDPTAFPGELPVIKENDLRAFDVIGYTLVPEPGLGSMLALGGLLLLIRRKLQARIWPAPNPSHL